MAATPFDPSRMDGQLLQIDTPSTGCDGFFDLAFDTRKFELYSKYFDENSTLFLPATGAYTGPEGIEEYIRFAFEDTCEFRRPFEKDQIAVFKGVNNDGECVFTNMVHGLFALNKTWADNPETAHFTTMTYVTYRPSTHKATPALSTHHTHSHRPSVPALPSIRLVTHLRYFVL